MNATFDPRNDQRYTYRRAIQLLLIYYRPVIGKKFIYYIAATFVENFTSGRIKLINLFTSAV